MNSISAKQLKAEAVDFTVRHALVALEKGATDKSILQYVNFLIRLTPIDQLSFLHVQPQIDFWDDVEMERRLNEDTGAQLDILQDLRKRTLARLELKENTLTDFGIRQGSPLEELLQEAKVLDVDLIITGLSTQRGAHGILPKVLARHASCNTLIVPDLSQASITNILVPIDFSENSAKALHTAVAINNDLTLPASITCVHVYDMPDMNWYRIQRTEDEFRKLLEENRKEALDKFLKKEIPEYHDRIETRLVPKMKPSIGSSIMDIVDEEGADLIIMGARGHSQIERLLMGSVTEKVLALTSHVPVLVVKASETD